MIESYINPIRCGLAMCYRYISNYDIKKNKYGKIKVQDCNSIIINEYNGNIELSGDEIEIYICKKCLNSV